MPLSVPDDAGQVLGNTKAEDNLNFLLYLKALPKNVNYSFLITYEFTTMKLIISSFFVLWNYALPIYGWCSTFQCCMIGPDSFLVPIRLER